MVSRFFIYSVRLSFAIKENPLMFNLKLLLAPTAVISALLAGALPAQAQSPACYTLESLQGQFAVVGTYGSNIAIAYGVRSHDAFGNMSAAFVTNQPVAGSPTGARTSVSGVNRATYAINCDGSGVVTRVATLADGTTIPAFDDFLVTEGVVQNGKLVATAMVDAQRIPSGIVLGGVFLTRKYTRLPNGCFSRESLRGSYGVVVNYGVNVALGIQPETLDGKGNLTRTGVLNQTTVGSPTGARTIGNVTSTGTYRVNCNGTGTIDRVVTRPDGTTAIASDDFMITEAIEKDGGLLATRIVDAQRDPSVIIPGGIFVTRVHSLRASPAEAGPTTPPAQGATVAVAGPKGATATASSIVLDGTKSAGADGKPLTYSWTMAAGSPVAVILGGTTATPTVQFSQGRGSYTFVLRVTDSTGVTVSDTVTVDYRGI